MRNGDDPKRARDKSASVARPGEARPTDTRPVADATPVDPPPRSKAPPRGQVNGPASAFDIWLDRDLHRMFDKVRAEPIPEELLRLINSDRNKS
jgi:hypothetical protein